MSDSRERKRPHWRDKYRSSDRRRTTDSTSRSKRFDRPVKKQRTDIQTHSHKSEGTFSRWDGGKYQRNVDHETQFTQGGLVVFSLLYPYTI